MNILAFNMNIFVVSINYLIVVLCVSFANSQEITQSCLRCICQAASGCNGNGCTLDVCGLYRITRGYWMDAGRPTIGNDQPSSDNAYVNCATNSDCSTRAVTAYMSRYAQDCNNDGIIDCFDYGAIHNLGGMGCRGQLSAQYRNTLNQCASSGTNGPRSNSGGFLIETITKVIQL